MVPFAAGHLPECAVAASRIRFAGRVDATRQCNQGAAQALRAGAAASAGGAREAEGVGADDGRAARDPVRGPRRCGQGRCDQAGDGVPEPACRTDRGAAGADRARAGSVVLPAVHRPPAERGGDRHLRPELVQPRRRRARDGLLHARRVSPLPPAVPDLRATDRRGRHSLDQVLVLGQRRRTGAPVPLAAGGSAAPLEALAAGSRVPRALGRVLAGEGRDVRPHRHSRRRPGTSSKATTNAGRGSTAWPTCSHSCRTRTCSRRRSSCRLGRRRASTSGRRGSSSATCRTTRRRFSTEGSLSPRRQSPGPDWSSGDGARRDRGRPRSGPPRARIARWEG